MRSRECDNPQPTNGGNDCDGKPEAKRDCNIKSCPSEYVTLVRQFFKTNVHFVRKTPNLAR